MDRPAEPSPDVQITVVVHRRERARGRLGAAVAVAAVVTAAGLALITHLPTVPPRHIRAGLRAAATTPGPAGVAGAYAYPLWCLSVTIATRDPAYARADFNRARLCGRFNGSTTAIFRRVDGRWRPVLDAVEYNCPVRSLPAVVQAELAVCPPTAARIPGRR